MRYSLVVGFILAVALGTSTAHATVDVSIDLTHQRMNVTSSSGSYSWPISSGRTGWPTPTGVFQPQSMHRMAYSRLFGNAPMPHAIFYSGNFAIHGTAATGALGSPASHGCVRLAPGHAATLFQMVSAEGARITIRGAPPVSRVARSTSRGKGSKIARGTPGHGTKHARSAHGSSRHIAAGAQPQPAPQNMFGLFSGGV